MLPGESGRVLCTARRTMPAAGTYRTVCTLGAGARKSLEKRPLRVRLATTFVAAGGQRVTRTTTVTIARIPSRRVPVTG